MASVLVPLAQGCEELEAVTVIDLLRRAGIEVISVGLDAQPVRASRGTVLIPDAVLDEVVDRDFDMIVLPGGLPGADHLDRDTRLRALITRAASAGRFVAAICAAPKVLVSAGLLDNRIATSFPGVLDPAKVPGLSYRDDAVVQDGKIITSRGPGTAMDFALTLIENLVGKEKRDQVEAALQRPRQPKAIAN